MKRQLGLSLMVLAVLSVSAWSQTGSDQSQGGSSDQSQAGSTDQSQTGSTDQSPSSTGPQVAYTHPEQLPPLTLLNEVTANTGIRINMTTGLLTDYAGTGGKASGYWQTLGSAAAGFELTQIRPTVEWDFRYNGGASLSALSLPHSSNYVAMNQTAGANVLWQLSPRMQLSLSDHYNYTNDPFEPYLTVERTPTFNQPNPVIYIPQAVVEQNVGSISLTYQIGAHDVFTLSGGESLQRFFNTTLSANNSFSYAATTSYEHDFSARLSSGIAYSFTALDFGHGLSRSGIQAVTGFASYRLTPHAYVTGFAGPEYTASKDIVPGFCFPGLGCFGYHPVYPTQWNAAEGATFGWSGTQNAVRIGFRHQVANGGGLLGAVRLYQSTIGFRRALNQRWNFSAGLSYNDSLSISQYSSSRFSKTLQGIATLSRHISPSLDASMYYALIHGSQNYYAYTSSGNLGTNGIGISLHYSWGHSLGR